MKPITEDYLIELKLPKRSVQSGPLPYNEYGIREGFNIYCEMCTSGNCLFWGECNEGLDFFIVKCDTVQAFQNIYEALTDKELVIMEKPAYQALSKTFKAANSSSSKKYYSPSKYFVSVPTKTN